MKYKDFVEADKGSWAVVLAPHKPKVSVITGVGKTYIYVSDNCEPKSWEELEDCEEHGVKPEQIIAIVDDSWYKTRANGIAKEVENE